MGYAAISTPTNLATQRSPRTAQRLLTRLSGPMDADERKAWAAWAMNHHADACRKYDRPFHLMVGVNREVYAGACRQDATSLTQ